MTLHVKLDQKLMGYITTFENLTKARVKDVFVLDDVLLFVVQTGEAGKAIGRRGSHSKRLTYLLKKKIKVIEHASTVENFITGFLDPLKVDKIDIQGSRVVLSVKDSSTKGKIIGRNGKNLHLFNDLVQRYYHKAVAVA
jgi:N utilization substance protein A